MDQVPAKIFLGGLSADATEQTLRNHFGAYGAITECVIMVDRDSGQSRGFGFVTFRTGGPGQKIRAKFSHTCA